MTAMSDWFLINTKPKKEFQVDQIFSEAGFEIYCPRYVSEKQVRPFFPGYAFLKFEHPAQYRLVRYTRGVKKIVGNDGGPIAVPPHVVDGIRDRERGGYIELLKFGEEPAIGDEIEVAEGPLKGLRGVFKKELGERERVMILLNYVSYQGQLLIERSKLRKVAG